MARKVLLEELTLEQKVDLWQQLMQRIPLRCPYCRNVLETYLGEYDGRRKNIYSHRWPRKCKHVKKRPILVPRGPGWAYFIQSVPSPPQGEEDWLPQPLDPDPDKEE